MLNEQVAKCDVLISVIGKGWIDARDEAGIRRLDNPDDFASSTFLSARCSAAIRACVSDRNRSWVRRTALRRASGFIVSGNYSGLGQARNPSVGGSGADAVRVEIEFALNQASEGNRFRFHPSNQISKSQISL